MLPAQQASRSDLAAMMMQNSSRAGTSGGAVRMQSVLVIVQVALAVLLVIGAGLMIRTFAALRRVEPGIDPHNSNRIGQRITIDKYLGRSFRRLLVKLLTS